MLTTFAARRLARAARCAATRSVNSGATPPVFRLATRAASSDSGAVADAPAAGGRSVGTATPEKSGVQPLIDTQPVRGTRDFPPEDMRLRNWLFNHFREVRALRGSPPSRVRWAERSSLPFVATRCRLCSASRSGTRLLWRVRACIRAKLGRRSLNRCAVVLQNISFVATGVSDAPLLTQLYNFEDKGGRRLALRPELTPSLARIVLAKGKGLALPAKWYAVGQCWRYERMTRGRRREHYQWNMDIVGVDGVAAEAELLSAITTFFARVGLTPADVGIRVSSRKVLAALLQAAGVPAESFAPVCVCVDKMEKVPREQVMSELSALGVPAAASEALMSAMDLKSIDQLEALLGPQAEAVQDMRALWELAQAYGYADWLVFDACVVRGLSYYTGVVFEAFDRAATLRCVSFALLQSL